MLGIEKKTLKIFSKSWWLKYVTVEKTKFYNFVKSKINNKNFEHEILNTKSKLMKNHTYGKIEA